MMPYLSIYPMCTCSTYWTSGLRNKERDVKLGRAVGGAGLGVLEEGE